jgi:hypothetical protein
MSTDVKYIISLGTDMAVLSISLTCIEKTFIKPSPQKVHGLSNYNSKSLGLLHVATHCCLLKSNTHYALRVSNGQWGQ